MNIRTFHEPVKRDANYHFLEWKAAKNGWQKGDRFFYLEKGDMLFCLTTL